MNPRAYMEVSPMFEEHWTGIPTVAAALASSAILDPAIDWRFTYENALLPTPLIERFLEQRSGVGGLEQLAGLVWQKLDVPFDDGKQAVGVFTSLKSVRRFYAQEAMVIYDLSPLLTPQFHTAPNIEHFTHRIRYDVETTDQFFCISEAAASDVVSYFAVPDEKVSIIPMAAAFSLSDLSVSQAVAQSYRIEPYVLVLGTLEPRKNGRMVLEYLLRNPEFSRRYRVVFVGRTGWMNENGDILTELEERGIGEDRILFTGYVSEVEKVGLLYNASFCIYASFFEGFGLPVLEASMLGQVVVCSNSSSMPEVAPDSCVFFDPNDINEFALAMSIADRRSMRTRLPQQSLEDLGHRLADHTWADCYKKVAEWVHDCKI